MASVINPICTLIAAHVVAGTDCTVCTVGYIETSQEQWPASHLLLDPASIRGEVNSTRDAAYPMVIGVYSHSFDVTNEITETLMTLWESSVQGTALAALGVIQLTATALHPGAMVPDIETDRGFYGEINFTITIRHNY